MAHRPLKRAEIRLLEISPRRAEDGPAEADDVECSFVYAGLEQEPVFEALSYVWGGESREGSIVLDGRPFPVTRSLHHALSHLRLPADKRVVWADAVCINQDDLAERAEQVALMRRIYRSARSVTVYLGEPWDGHRLATDFFRAAADLPDHHYEPSLEPHLSVRGHDANSALLRQNLIRFLALPWWRRSWTVQEYALAREVNFQCGDTVLEGRVVQDAYSNLRSHEYTCCWDSPAVARDATFGVCLLHAFFRMDATELAREASGGHNHVPGPECATPIKFSQSTETPEQQAAYTISRSPLTFLGALDTFRERECRDPRDKIYGITGLYFADGVAEFFKKPDYRTRVEDLYTTLAHTMIRETGTLDVVARARGYRESALDLPSFVPDWSVSHPVEVDRLARLHEYDASGGRRADWTAAGPKTARTRAVLLDRIRGCAEHHQSDTSLGATLQNWAALGGLRFADGDFDKKTGVFDRSVPFWRTLCGNMIRFRVGSKLVSQTLDVAEPRGRAEDVVYDAFLGWYAWATKRPDALHTPEIADFLSLFETMNTGRRFASTETGRYGMVPAMTRGGDVVVVMPGGQAPFVLRPVENGTYELVGEAYFYGLMTGEGFHGVADADLQTVLLV